MMRYSIADCITLSGCNAAGNKMLTRTLSIQLPLIKNQLRPKTSILTVFNFSIGFLE